MRRLQELAQAIQRYLSASPDDDAPPPAIRRSRLILGAVTFFLLGVVVMAWLNGDGLTSQSRYHYDLTQSPHWMAYHNDHFPADDLMVLYGIYNESPLQNVIYWVGTLFIDVVPLQKLVACVMFGATAALFFVLVTLTGGPWTGTLAGLVFLITPRTTYEIGGGYSKAWALAFVLLAVYVVETRRFRILPWTMPIAALAYPVSPVLMGAIVSIGIVLDLGRPADAWRGFKWLSGASALALVPLLYKYFLTPQDWIGEMYTPEETRQMWERGESFSATTPLYEDLLDLPRQPLRHLRRLRPLDLLSRRGLVWQRSWTALAISSTIAYYVADAVVPQLYLPDRYSRFGAAVLLVLWFAHNGARLLDVVRGPRLRAALMLAAIALGAWSFDDTFRPCVGERSHGLWEDEDRFIGLSAAIRELDEPVLIAGHPRYMAHVVVQARRPVLMVDRMYHAWYKTYRAEVRGRIKAVFAAAYASRPDQVNQLAERYGVTHLIVRKEHYTGWSVAQGQMYRPEFHSFIRSRVVDSRARFLLFPPRPEWVVFEDDEFWLVELPLP